MNTLDHELFGFLSTALKLIAFIPYVLYLYKGRAKPHLFTWLIWSLIMAIVFVIQVTEGAGPGAWAIGISSVAYLGIAFYAYFHGEKNITASDLCSVVVAFCAIPAWYFTNNPALAILLMCVIDMIAYYPTYRKSWDKPYDEPALPFAMSGAALFLSIAALEQTSASILLYPMLLGFTDIAFAGYLMQRRLMVHHAEQLQSQNAAVTIKPAENPGFAPMGIRASNDNPARSVPVVLAQNYSELPK